MSPEPGPRDRLHRLLGSADLAWLVERVRRRIERGEAIAGTVTLTASTAAQRNAVERLLGRRPRSGGALSVRLDDVDALVRRSGAHPDGLAAAVVALRGPVANRADADAAREASWAAAFAPLDAAAASRAELRPWADGLRATGAVRRVAPEPAAAAALLRDLAAAVEALPVEAQPVGRFAERVLGAAHALDVDRPLTGLLFGAARVLGGVGDGQGASWRREVWASVGLVRDELSSTVLTLGLPGDSATPTGRMLAALTAAGEPAVLTLRQLVREAPHLPLADRTLSVCENPVVVAAAADQLGPHCAPLVCASGQPGAAVMALLRIAVAGGAILRYHGDFDWGGLRIGNVLFDRLPMAHWRFDAAAYRAATDIGATDGATDGGAAGIGRPLTGPPVAASWDPELATAIAGAGRAVEEERVLDTLLADLRSPGAAPAPAPERT